MMKSFNSKSRFGGTEDLIELKSLVAVLLSVLLFAFISGSFGSSTNPNCIQSESKVIKELGKCSNHKFGSGIYHEEFRSEFVFSVRKIMKV
ncbi:MAG: hypothetical protein FJ213_12225 [Ignavibacteria bacterium]|nr:hypothetical protein [Ignavibacteria bacterium]